MTGDCRPTASVWVGRVLSALVAILLFADGANVLFSPETTKAQLAATGFPDWAGTPIGLIALVSALVYAWPRTATLGAILLTGFLGGAICTHFRLGEIGSAPQIICLLLGALTWGGLYLRAARIRKLLPLTA